MPLKKAPIKSGTTKEKKTNTKTSQKDKSAELDLKKFRDDIDSKKEFFRLMAEKIKENNFNSEEDDLNYIGGAQKGPRSVSYYQRSLWKYLVLVLILLLAVAYFSLGRLEISIHTDKELVEDSLNFYAYSNENQSDTDRAIKTLINSVEVDLSEVFPATGQKNLGGEIVGRVKIINEYSKNQPLVATTRLLSPDDKLFRIKDTVNVPAGSSVEVDIYADKISSDMAISPTTFTIPGLWEGLQDKIYAESYEKFELKENVNKFLTQNDIDNAVNLMKEEIIKEAESKALLYSNSKQETLINIDKNNISLEMNQKLGDEADSFNLKAKGLVNIIALNKDDVFDLIKKKLNILESFQGKVDIVYDSLEYELVDFDPERFMAEVKVNFSSRGVFNEEGEMINPRHLVNLNEKQIKAYLDKINGLKSYELFFRPSFIKHSPILVDRILINYK